MGRSLTLHTPNPHPDLWPNFTQCGVRVFAFPCCQYKIECDNNPWYQFRMDWMTLILLILAGGEGEAVGHESAEVTMQCCSDGLIL